MNDYWHMFQFGKREWRIESQICFEFEFHDQEHLRCSKLERMFQLLSVYAASQVSNPTKKKFLWDDDAQ